MIRPHEFGELSPCGLGLVTLRDAGGFTDGLDDRPECDAVAVGEAAAAQRDGGAADPAEELLRESRLPDAGLAHQRHGPTASLVAGELVRRDEGVELGV